MGDDKEPETLEKMVRFADSIDGSGVAISC